MKMFLWFEEMKRNGADDWWLSDFRMMHNPETLEAFKSDVIQGNYQSVNGDLSKHVAFADNFKVYRNGSLYMSNRVVNISLVN
jgi:hypothetical protein